MKYFMFTGGDASYLYWDACHCRRDIDLQCFTEEANTIPVLGQRRLPTGLSQGRNRYEVQKREDVDENVDWLKEVEGGETLMQKLHNIGFISDNCGQLNAARKILQGAAFSESSRKMEHERAEIEEGSSSACRTRHDIGMRTTTADTWGSVRKTWQKNLSSNTLRKMKHEQAEETGPNACKKRYHTVFTTEKSGLVRIWQEYYTEDALSETTIQIRRE